MVARALHVPASFRADSDDASSNILLGCLCAWDLRIRTRTAGTACARGKGFPFGYAGGGGGGRLDSTHGACTGECRLLRAFAHPRVRRARARVVTGKYPVTVTAYYPVTCSSLRCALRVVAIQAKLHALICRVTCYDFKGRGCAV